LRGLDVSVHQNITFLPAGRKEGKPRVSTRGAGFPKSSYPQIVPRSDFKVDGRWFLFLTTILKALGTSAMSDLDCSAASE